MSNPCYVVFDARELGVYYNWPNYHRQVHRFHGACYKSTTLIKKELLPSSQEPTQIQP
jgi:viroplasmin and RNaseH domain-containing protein